LEPADYPSASEADFATVGMLWFWRFDEQQIAKILKQYRYRDKLDRDDYIKRTISKAATGEQYEPGQTGTDVDPKTADWEDIKHELQSDDGTAQNARHMMLNRLLNNHTFRTLIENDEIFYYDKQNGTFSPTGLAKLRGLLSDRLGPFYKRHHLNEVKSALRGQTTLSQEEMGGPANMVCVENGVLAISENGHTLVDHSPHYNFLSRLNTKYDPAADCPQFREFLEDVMPQERDRKKLQEFAGYTLMHWRIKWDKALFIVGPQASGKSTFADTLRALHGDQNVCSVAPQQLTERFGGAELYGKWVNIRNDIPAESVSRTGTIKEIIAGDPIKAEKKGQDPFHFKPTAKHLFVANQLPDTENDDAAFYRRILLIPFPHTVPRQERDLELEEKLQDELPGILNWALDGLKRLQQQGGFTGDVGPSQTAEKWDKWGHTVDRFYQACIEIDPDANPIPKDTLYGLYRQFCEEENMPCDMQQAMTRRLKTEHGVKDSHARVDGENKRVFTNVDLTSRAGRYDDDDDSQDSDIDKY
jgi:putative DNA primase/helicase